MVLSIPPMVMMVVIVVKVVLERGRRQHVLL